MTKETTPNYTPAQESLITAAIAANGGVANKSVAEKLAADPAMNGPDGPRKVRSIIAKMTRMGGYQRQVPVSKTGKPVASKATLVERIAENIGATVAALDGLDKAPKLTLETLVERTGTDG